MGEGEGEGVAESTPGWCMCFLEARQLTVKVESGRTEVSSDRADHLFPQDSVYKDRGSYLEFVWSRGSQVAVCVLM